MDGLKRCPFCQSESVKVIVKKCRRYNRGVRTNGFMVFVRCNVCLARGPVIGDAMFYKRNGKDTIDVEKVTDVAVDGWNRRSNRNGQR